MVKTPPLHPCPCSSSFSSNPPQSSSPCREKKIRCITFSDFLNLPNNKCHSYGQTAPKYHKHHSEVHSMCWSNYSVERFLAPFSSSHLLFLSVHDIVSLSKVTIFSLCKLRSVPSNVDCDWKTVLWEIIRWISNVRPTIHIHKRTLTFHSNCGLFQLFISADL